MARAGASSLNGLSEDSDEMGDAGSGGEFMVVALKVR